MIGEPEAQETTAAEDGDEPPPPAFVVVLARILVRLALEAEGVLTPANENSCPPR